MKIKDLPKSDKQGEIMIKDKINKIVKIAKALNVGLEDLTK